MKINRTLLTVVLFSIFLGACSHSGGMTGLTPSGVPTPGLTPNASRQPPTPSAALAPSPTPTLDNVSVWATWLASRPRNMEAYGKVFDPEVTAELPPVSSVNMPIWNERLPLQVLDHSPQFVGTSPLRPPPDLNSALTRANCTAQYGQLDCSTTSPLMDFGCEWLSVPQGTYPALSEDQQVIAICLKTPADENETRDSFLYRTGCAFRRDAGLILVKHDAYQMLTKPAEVRRLLLPIDSPEEALTYLEMMTGLTATYLFEADPMLLYFMDPLEGTRVIADNDSYRVNLFQYAHCLCEPWVDSRVELQVDRLGNITWLGALPISMTVGFSCAD